MVLVVLTLGAAIVALGMLHDYLLPVVFFGSQPALIVLLMVGLVQWLLQERYRRQLVFMPTFSRANQGSTFARDTAKKPRENSTIDAPAAAASAGSTGSAVGHKSNS